MSKKAKHKGCNWLKGRAKRKNEAILDAGAGAWALSNFGGADLKDARRANGWCVWRR